MGTGTLSYSSSSLSSSVLIVTALARRFACAHRPACTQRQNRPGSAPRVVRRRTARTRGARVPGTHLVVMLAAVAAVVCGGVRGVALHAGAVATLGVCCPARGWAVRARWHPSARLRRTPGAGCMGETHPGRGAAPERGARARCGRRDAPGVQGRAPRIMQCSTSSITYAWSRTVLRHAASPRAWGTPAPLSGFVSG